MGEEKHAYMLTSNIMDLLTIFNLSVDYCDPQLSSHTSWKVGLLRYFYGTPCDISSHERVNIDAILRDYLQDRMEFDPTMVSIWFAGNRVMRPMPENTFRHRRYDQLGRRLGEKIWTWACMDRVCTLIPLPYAGNAKLIIVRRHRSTQLVCPIRPSHLTCPT